MLIWVIIALVLAFLTVIEMMLGFTIPFPALRSTTLFLVILGMAYRIHIMEKGGEKEAMKSRIRELEDKMREEAMGA
ncbi:MAG: hypothetical protein ACC669_06700 [bacterium]